MITKAKMIAKPKVDLSTNVWWKDKKLLAGFVLVLLSIILGFYGKGLLIVRFYEPFYIITGLSLWILSWVLLFLGVFLVGWETIKMIQMSIHNHVKKTVKGTYHYTKDKYRKFGRNYKKEESNYRVHSSEKHILPGLLSFFIPALGQFIKGQVKWGLAIWLSFILGNFLILTIFGAFKPFTITLFIIFNVFMWIYQIYDAYNH